MKRRLDFSILLAIVRFPSCARKGKKVPENKKVSDPGNGIEDFIVERTAVCAAAEFLDHLCLFCQSTKRAERRTVQFWKTCFIVPSFPTL
jgi:hypothetical protein